MKKMFLLAAVSILATAVLPRFAFGAQVIGSAGSASIKSEEISEFQKNTNEDRFWSRRLSHKIYV